MNTPNVRVIAVHIPKHAALVLDPVEIGISRNHIRLASFYLNKGLADEIMMMEQQDEGGQPSGLLSPRRIEAIDTAFNTFFENARKEGTIRDPSTYKSFDHVYEIAMKERNTKDRDEVVEEERMESTYWNDDSFDNGDYEVKRRRRSSEVAERNLQIVPQEVEDDTALLSDDDEYRPPPSPPEHRPGRRKRTIEHVEYPLEDFNSSKPRPPHSGRHKRPRRRPEEVDRHFACIWPGCGKAYGFLHHLNTHIRNSKHGPEQRASRRSRKKRHSEPRPTRHRDLSPRRSTFTPPRITISSDTEPSPQSPKSKHPSSIQQRPSVEKDYLGIPPFTTITLVHQRHAPPKPRGLHLPFWGRRRSRTKKISLDRLWEVHYRLERLRKAGLSTVILKSTETLGRGRGRGRGFGRGRGRGAGRGTSSGGVGGSVNIIGNGDVNNLKVRSEGRLGGPSYEQSLVNGIMGQRRSRSPEL